MIFTPARALPAILPALLGVGLLALVSANGCGQKGTAPGACAVNGDCPAGDSCVSGQCRTGACSVDADCADGGGVCTNETCTVPDAGDDAGLSGPCTENAQCGSGALCIAGECIPQDAGTGIGCTTNADCPGSDTCIDAQCTPAGGGTGGCASATDCSGNATGTVCLNGTCGCTSATDCPDPTDSCVASQCLAGVSTDAGTTGGGGGGGVGGGCTSDTDCSGDPTTPVCDTAAGQCVPCTTAENMCPSGQTCVTDTCVAGGGGGGGTGGGGGGGGGGTCLPFGAGLCSTVCGILGGTCDSMGNCCI